MPERQAKKPEKNEPCSCCGKRFFFHQNVKFLSNIANAKTEKPPGGGKNGRAGNAHLSERILLFIRKTNHLESPRELNLKGD